MMTADSYKPLKDPQAAAGRVPFDPLQDTLPTGRRCPGCGWTDTRRSMTHAFLDRLFGLIGLVPYRCRTCGERFYRTRL